MRIYKPFPAEFKIILKKKNEYLMVFPKDPSIMWVNKPIMDILELTPKFSKTQIFKRLLIKHKKETLIDAYKDLYFLKEIGFLKTRSRRPWLRLTYSSNIKPISIWLHLTHRCNLNCPYCYSSGFRAKRESLKKNIDMDWATAKRIIDWVFKVHNRPSDNKIGFVFFGGEPLLNLDTMKRSMEYIKDKWQEDQTKVIGITVITNGMLINRRIANMLKKYKAKIRITIHRRNDQVFNKDMIRKIRMLKGIVPSSNILVNRIFRDKKDMKPILPELKKIRGITQTFTPDFTLKKQELLTVFKGIKGISRKLAKNKSAKTLFLYGDMELDMLISGISIPENCGAAQTYIDFFPDGSIYSCAGPAACNVSSTLGNIHEGGIDKKLYKYALKKIHQKDRLKTDCMKCWIRSYCRGRCKYSDTRPSVVDGENLICDFHRHFKAEFIKIFADMDIRDMLSLTPLGFNSMGESRDKHETLELLLHLRDLQNKRLRYARLVTPMLHNK